MIPVPTAPFPNPRPLATCLITPSQVPEVRLLAGAGTAVMALPNRFSMTYLLLSADGVAVVDVGSHADVPRILDALRWLGRSPSQVRCVVVSHHHFDHVMGIDALARRCGCPVAVSRRAFDAFHGGTPLRRPPGRSAWPLAYGWAIQGFPVLPADDWRVVRRFLDPSAPNPFASDLLALDDGRPLPGLEGWRVLSAPGHSDDAMALFHARAGFLVTGDTIRNFFGGEWNPVQTDPEAFRRTRALLCTLPVRAVFPGHGPVMEGDRVVQRLTVVGG